MCDDEQRASVYIPEIQNRVKHREQAIPRIEEPRHGPPWCGFFPLGPEAKQLPLTSAPGGRGACEVTEALLRGASVGSK